MQAAKFAVQTRGDAATMGMKGLSVGPRARASAQFCAHHPAPWSSKIKYGIGLYRHTSSASHETKQTLTSATSLRSQSQRTVSAVLICQHRWPQDQ